MKTGYMILSAASIIPLLSSCASYQKTSDSEAWSIKPAFNVRHSTGTPDAYYQLGRYYQGQNRYELAIDAYQKALAIDSAFAEARNGLGVNYAMQGRQQEALEQFRLAVKQAPNAAHIHNNLGYALYLSGSYAEAASALEQAVALEPSNQAAHTNLALALGKAGDRGKAVQVMTQAAMPQFAENAPLVAQEAQQALALPKDWGVITQAARKPVPQVESRIQAVQVEPNVYELRERAEVQVQAVSAKPIQPASAQPKERNLITAQSTQKPVAVAENRAQAAQPVSNVAKQQTQTATPVAKPYRIEISNGNGVTGMARKVAGFLNGEGYPRARLTNQKTFAVSYSRISYRQGYQDEAKLLMGKLPGQTDLVQTDDMRKDISVQIVLGKDIAGSVAYFGGDKKVKLARTGSDS